MMCVVYEERGERRRWRGPCHNIWERERAVRGGERACAMVAESGGVRGPLSGFLSLSVASAEVRMTFELQI